MAWLEKLLRSKAVVVTLIVLPVSYYWAGAARAWWNRRRGRPMPPQVPRATAG